MDKLIYAIIIAILGVLYLIFSDIVELKNSINVIKEQAKEINAAQSSLNKRLDVREIDKLYELKLAKNLEVLGDISCGECHNASDMALPIRKITLNEAIAIVRFGNERTNKLGMPTYKSYNNGKDPFIADSGLKKRLEILYTDELLKTAVNKE